MYLIREVLYCRPGKVGSLVQKFRDLGRVMERHEYEPFRIYTDVSGERFWTVVLESEAETMDSSRDMEANVMADEEAQEIMAGYHDLVMEGRREIYRVEG